MDKKVIIIGAGLTGLTTAYFLKKNKFNNFILFEKEGKIGGYCKTIKKNEYKYDMTGHALHLKTEEIKYFLLEELSLKNELKLVGRESYIYFKNKFVPYPFQLSLYYLDYEDKYYILKEYINTYCSKIKDTTNIKNIKNFKDYCYAFFGKGISDLFMIPYNEKIWSYPAEKLGFEWMGRFVPKIDLGKIIEATLKPIKNDIGYNSQFYYPKNTGIEIIPETIYRKAQLGNNVFYEEVIKVDLNLKKVYTDKSEYKYNILINTLPLNRFLDMIQYSHELKSTITRVLIVEIENLKKEFSWIYFPQKNIPFYRIGNFKKFNSKLNNEKDLLYVEISSLYPMPNNTSKNEIVNELKKIFGNVKVNIVDDFIMENSYVVYESWRKQNLDNVLKFLEKNSIYSIGRYGAWKYDSMEGAMLDGKKIVSQISNNLFEK
ncbi:hypothetical protein X275_11075 [Marinitoga sp. 1197]|uniref:protoporphyrinogen/coproporphyrinogen oxidase n=1 Tax=Marinitoga sp. 1197 TaxID=1428449 RepID=UPI000640F4B6|nr:NAD(P)-binding protein [Marinitoga sp. 1197]KLO20836.1 hypothetical protein X275_11075 [Marinitoga sp. 1197]